MKQSFDARPDGAALHAFLRDRSFRSRCRTRARVLDSASGFPPIDDLEEMAHVGLLYAPLPHALDGLGWGTEPEGALALYEALRLIGRISLPLGELYQGHIHAVRLVMQYGTAAQRDVVRDSIQQRRLFGVWHTDLPSAPLQAVNGYFVGGKDLCAGTGLVERAIVTARTPSGGPQQMFLVPLDRFSDRGDLSDWNLTGMRASARGKVDLDGMALAQCLKLGGPDDYLGQPDFSAGGWRHLAVQVGGIEDIVQALRQHIARTECGLDPHQLERFGFAVTAAETAHLWSRQACHLAEAGTADVDRVVSYVDLARGAVERAALVAIEAVNRSMGLEALAPSRPLDRSVRDLATYLRHPCPDRALMAGALAGLSFEEHVGDTW
jgi:alkylation response protein AidB-like acyl-CoA dehydrogenase